ncbi:iron-containing alcohol dehydrogenase [Rhodococcus fascians]|nr:iron-containing alcohol dehydrogenase [Rhodococcus fascians]MBY4116484.1 iron-containing alcohol dehydrogenase [Rhodococcus fascians]
MTDRTTTDRPEAGLRFTHQTLAQRVVFAPGSAADAVVDEVLELGAGRAMLIASHREAALSTPVAEALRSARVDVVLHEEVEMHVPIAVADRARAVAEAAKVDVVLTVGGGSTTGVGKAVVMAGSPTAGRPLISVPTTYAGSEATNVWGLTSPGPDGGVKRTGVDHRVLPTAIVYDATLLVSLPGELAVASGLNALAHAVDSMWGPRTDPIDQALAQEGIRALAAGLVTLHADGSSLDGVERTLYGAYLAAVSFASAGSGMHHKICHVLGGMFNLPHAQTHAIVLPHVLAFNAPNAPAAERRIADAFGSATATEGLHSLRTELQAPTALKDFGMPHAGIDKAVDAIVAAIPKNNPTPIDAGSVAALVEAAWQGDSA